MKRLSAISVLISCCLFWAALNFGQCSYAQEEASLRFLLEGKQTALTLMKNLIEEASADLEASQDKTVQELVDQQWRFFELLMLIRTSFANPYEASIIHEDLYSLSRDLDKLLSPLRSIQENIDINKAPLKIFAKDLTEMAGKAKDPALRGQIRKLAVFAGKVTNSLRALEQKVEKRSQLIKDQKNQVDKELASLSLRLPKIWKKYFLFRNDSLFSPDLWSAFPIVFDAWLDALPRFIRPKLPIYPQRLFEIGENILLISLPIFLIGILFYKRKLKSRLQGNAQTRHMLFNFWSCVLLALAVFYYCGQERFPYTWFWEILATTLIARAIMSLAAGLRNLQFNTKLPSPFNPLFGLYVVFSLVQYLSAFGPFLVIIWVAGLIMMLYFNRRALLREYPPLEHTLLKVTMVLGFIALVLAVSGFLLPSLYLVVFWVMAAPAVQLIWVTNHHLNAFIDKARLGGGIIVYGLVSGLGNPFIWLSFLTIITFWLSHHLGGMYLLSEAINWRYTWHGLTISFSHAMAVVFLFFLFKYIIFIVHSILARLRDWSRLDQGVVPSLQTISSYLLWTLFTYIVLMLFGLNLTTLLVIAGGMSVGIGFGLQNIVNNFISGLIILFGRPLHHGDVVELDNRIGRVVKINIRSTVIQTFDNAIVFIPNSDIISKNLVNWSKNNRKVRRDIMVGVAYGANAAKVEKVLLETAQNHPHVMKSPAPQVLFTDFADSSLVFTLRIWVNNYNNTISTQSDLRKNIYTAFGEAEIEIAFPQLDLHIKDTPDLKSKGPAVVPK